jgi:hypothetical protein
MQKEQGKTGSAIADVMLKQITETGLARILAPKVDALLTDQASPQLVANALVASELAKLGDNEQEISYVPCCMHSGN